ncbi:MAG: hypothetical protein OIN89_05910 [Candidatus Methanoperedens sp.]|jgi:hypothetical protein|nr:hypothetical protein [Candidatus Methanoperedens sp.]PKL53862.1 MAG: hypothetical protein CVV36_05005 [Candidatus Methanoperedenaceae archaeon HGW-Methanoperedenaceae-1]
MSEYWGMPEKEYDLSLFQFARDKLSEKGYSVLSERVEVCSGAGALTLTAIIGTGDSRFGLYLHDGAKHRKSRGPPVIKLLRLLEGMKTAEDLRLFVINHQHDFDIILSPVDADMAGRVERDMKEIYMHLYNLKIKDMYDNDLSNAADVLRKRMRRVIREL